MFHSVWDKICLTNECAPSITVLVQKVIERREKIDWKRNAAFACFGFIYLGGVQYSLYVPIFGRLFPSAQAFTALPLSKKLKDGKGMLTVFAQTFLDQCATTYLLS
jgi:hypothetical protein